MSDSAAEARVEQDTSQPEQDTTEEDPAEQDTSAPDAFEPDAAEQTPAETAENAEELTASDEQADDSSEVAAATVPKKKVRRKRVPKPPSAARTWLAANRTRVMVISSAASLIAASAFAAATVQPLLAERATIATKLKIARTAADAITTLWSYTPENMNSLSDRASKYLAGDFEEQYRKYVDAIAETNKQAGVTSDTTVVGAAVESLNGADATALVYTNTTSTTAKSNNIPSMQYLSYRLDLRRDGRDWRVTRMTTVTSLDLTPKL